MRNRFYKKCKVLEKFVFEVDDGFDTRVTKFLVKNEYKKKTKIVNRDDLIYRIVR